jgi:twitching motility protein PilT
MARIDSILAIVLQQGGNELRVGTDREPKLLAHGTAKRFSMPKTSEETLRELLGEILSPEREASIRDCGRIDVPYATEGGDTFLVTLTGRTTEGFDAQFVRSAARPAPSLRMQPSLLAPRQSDEQVPRPAEVRAVEGPSFSLHDSELVARACAARATDLHLIEGDSPVLRVDGRLVRLDDGPIADMATVLGLGDSERSALARGESVELAAEVDAGRRARVHVYRTSAGTAAAIRILPRTPASLASLNLPLSLEDTVDIAHGLVLVCGATGSGKSTTVAALAQEALRRRSIVLVTLEDPIEYVLAGGASSIVRQRQISRDVPTFASGLRDALREDPDVLVVGELRDPETIALALTAAETGHLVLATLHSGGAASAIERIVDAYPNERQSQIRTQLADALRVVVAQRLLPRAKGTGRIPAIEVLRMTHAAANMVREGKTAHLASVIQSGRREGMISLERSLADRVAAGEIKLEHARAAANDAEGLAMCLAR